MRLLISILIFLFATSLVAQKRLSQTYDADLVSELYINSNEIFEITLFTIDTDVITINTIIDGETFASTLLNTIVEDRILKITTGKTPDYIPFNDKLSAHKVLAIELEIFVPENLDISIFSTLASTEMKGNLGKVRVDLGRGHFKGESISFRESATINTISGSITMDVTKAAVSAKSRNGTVVVAKDLDTEPPLTLESLHGDIIVTKSK